jgi:hypothetical protein
MYSTLGLSLTLNMQCVALYSTGIVQYRYNHMNVKEHAVGVPTLGNEVVHSLIVRQTHAGLESNIMSQSCVVFTRYYTISAGVHIPPPAFM